LVVIQTILEDKVEKLFKNVENSLSQTIENNQRDFNEKIIENLRINEAI
jgi:hypothetical protein